MTTTTLTTTTWRCAQAGLWVATGTDGHPVGIVSERWRHGFVVTSSNGRDLGTFTSLEDAQSALADAAALVK